MDVHHPPVTTTGATVLARIQDDIRADVASRSHPPVPHDGSVTIHACHGPARQVEVLRESLLHLLNDDPTLQPRDVIIMCPDVDTFAPLLAAAFGAAGRPASRSPAAGAAGRPQPGAHQPAAGYRGCPAAAGRRADHRDPGAGPGRPRTGRAPVLVCRRRPGHAAPVVGAGRGAVGTRPSTSATPSAWVRSRRTPSRRPAIASCSASPPTTPA